MVSVCVSRFPFLEVVLKPRTCILLMKRMSIFFEHTCRSTFRLLMINFLTANDRLNPMEYIFFGIKLNYLPLQNNAPLKIVIRELKLDQLIEEELCEEEKKRKEL